MHIELQKRGMLLRAARRTYVPCALTWSGREGMKAGENDY